MVVACTWPVDGYKSRLGLLVFAGTVIMHPVSGRTKSTNVVEISMMFGNSKFSIHVTRLLLAPGQ